MKIQEILCIIEQLETEIIRGKRNNGKLLIGQIVSDAKLNALAELKNEIINYNKEKHK